MSVLEQRESLREKISRLKSPLAIQFLDDEASKWLRQEMDELRDWWATLTDEQIEQLNKYWPTGTRPGPADEIKPAYSIAGFLEEIGVNGPFSNASQQIVSWSDFQKKVTIELGRKALRDCQKAAGESGLSSMTMEEINAEIAAYRAERHAKNHS